MKPDGIVTDGMQNMQSEGVQNVQSDDVMFDGMMSAEPEVDEEVEKALLEAMNIDTPDLWGRIMAGLDAPENADGPIRETSI